MIVPEKILEKLSELVTATPTEDGVRITTHVLYPSNAAVTVTVRGGENAFFVSDEAGAATELHKGGIVTLSYDRRFWHQVKRLGLRVSDGAILSPMVPLNDVGGAAVLVANASRTIAEWGFLNLYYRERRNFRQDLAELLGRHFHDALKSDGVFVGKSNKTHRFSHVVNLRGDRQLLVDPVVNDASSINARLVANLDVKLTENPKIQQMIVYDDHLKWKASDLRLLEMGASVVAFSSAEREIDRIAA